ncbi:MAG: hypothetical protein Q4F65_01030 [Propionibacteriaceae bacterium]|nr:hypothetical protein [Propionibacteriaceae bacterium]
MRRYARGKVDLPEMGSNLRESWEAFQRKSRTDFGGIAVRSLRNRIRPNGIRIGDSDDHPALEAARRFWRNNRAEIEVAEAVRDYLELSIGYLLVEHDNSGGVLFRREAPEQFLAIPDPVTSWRARAAIKVWRDDVSGLDHCRVILPGVVQDFTRPSKKGNGQLHLTVGDAKNWTPTGEPVEHPGGTGVSILDRGEDGAFLAPHLDLLDRITLGKLQRLVIVAMQAFRQRALKPKDGAEGLPDTDGEGNSINWAGAFSPAPGALWELPAGIDVWESQTAEVQPLLEGEKSDARDFAAASGTPISALIPDGQNQSAEGAANAKEQQIAQARDDIERIRPALQGAVKHALEVAGLAVGEADTIEVLFAPPEHVSLSERYAAAVQAKGAGLSARTIKRDILGMTPEQIEQDEADAGADMLAAALMGRPAARQDETTVPVIEEGADGGGTDAGAA